MGNFIPNHPGPTPLSVIFFIVGFTNNLAVEIFGNLVKQLLENLASNFKFVSVRPCSGYVISFLFKSE